MNFYDLTIKLNIETPGESGEPQSSFGFLFTERQKSQNEIPSAKLYLIQSVISTEWILIQ